MNEEEKEKLVIRLRNVIALLENEGFDECYNSNNNVILNLNPGSIFIEDGDNQGSSWHKSSSAIVLGPKRMPMPCPRCKGTGRLSVTI